MTFFILYFYADDQFSTLDAKYYKTWFPVSTSTREITLPRPNGTVVFLPRWCHFDLRMLRRLNKIVTMPTKPSHHNFLMFLEQIFRGLHAAGLTDRSFSLGRHRDVPCQNWWFFGLFVQNCSLTFRNIHSWGSFCYHTDSKFIQIKNTNDKNVTYL